MPQLILKRLETEAQRLIPDIRKENLIILWPLLQKKKIHYLITLSGIPSRLFYSSGWENLLNLPGAFKSTPCYRPCKSCPIGTMLGAKKIPISDWIPSICYGSLVIGDSGKRRLSAWRILGTQLTACSGALLSVSPLTKTGRIGIRNLQRLMASTGLPGNSVSRYSHLP